jgi:MFS family permease
MTAKPPQPKDESEKEATPVASRWVAATSDLTATAKWLATTIGAVAAVALGTGPFLVAPKVDVFGGGWPAWRAIAFVICLLVAVLGVAVVIWQLLLLQSPKPLSLNAIPAQTRAELDEDPENYPAGTSNFRHFVMRLRDEKAALRGARHRAAAETDEGPRKMWVSLAQARRDSLEDLNAAGAAVGSEVAADLGSSRAYPRPWGLPVDRECQLRRRHCHRKP